MKVSDIIRLEPGVFQLEEGCCEWDAGEPYEAQILYGGIHTELRAITAGEEDHVFLPSALEDYNLEELSVSHEGKYSDTSGKEDELARKVFGTLATLRVGQKVMIEDEEASKIYVIKLQDIRKSVEGSVQSLLESCQIDENASPSQALAPELLPGRWELVMRP